MPWLRAGFCGCFWVCRTHLGCVSLNRSEQRLFDYIDANRDERHFWEQKVRRIEADLKDHVRVCQALELEIWRYYVERSGVVPVLREVAAREGLKRTSMRNLADYMLLIWGVPKPPKKRNPML